MADAEDALERCCLQQRGIPAGMLSLCPLQPPENQRTLSVVSPGEGEVSNGRFVLRMGGDGCWLHSTLSPFLFSIQYFAEKEKV